MQKAVEYLSSRPAGDVGKIFVIGGAQIYQAAFELPEAKRVLLTRVIRDFDCDTFFPLELDESSAEGKWTRRSKEELDRWTGETVPEGIQEENQTQYEFQMWEKVD